MRYILNSKQMKQIDSYSIKQVGIPSVVLMERASYAVTKRVVEKLQGSIEAKGQLSRETNNCRVLCVCGTGNNGADGIAVARQLNELGYKVDIYIAKESEKSGTEEFELQKKTAVNLGIVFVNDFYNTEYNIIVDALFGIGLSREIKGFYKEVVDKINALKTARKEQICIVSVDIPSGVSGNSGQIMGCAVKADITVTFGYEKLGMVMYPGKEYCGNIFIENAGFAPKAIENIENAIFTYEENDIEKIGKRKADGNKGTFGKILIAAGSENMGGAACMAAKSAYKSGCGLVKVLTHVNNRDAVLYHVPEAVLETYDSYNSIEKDIYEHNKNAVSDNQNSNSNNNTNSSAQNYNNQINNFISGEQREDLKKKLISSVKWADIIVAGPGFSKGPEARDMTAALISNMIENGNEKIYIFDADALNIIAEDIELKNKLKVAASQGIHIIVTPHMGEMSRLTDIGISELKQDPCRYAEEFASSGVICVLKDARTVVSDGAHTYINTSGNSGMATAGSGDILTGIIAGAVQAGVYLNGEMLQLVYAAAMGVYLHGRAGDYAKKLSGERGMTAMDIADNIPKAYMVDKNEG